jgi:hypothetical protein
MGSATFFLVSCGGGGGGSGGSSSTGSSGTGSVAVFVADNPADECNEINIFITEVSLIPVGGGAPIVVFESKSPDGYKVNILEYKDENFFLSVKDVPAGEYAKIRLKVAKIKVLGGPCDNTDPENHENLEVKLPSGKIDLNPQGSFRITHKGYVNITLDFDANKSFQLKPAGKSGKCIFRPVIFVDIEKGELEPRCPRMLTGKIGDVEEVKGKIRFELERDGLATNLVYLGPDAVIFDEDGFPVLPSNYLTFLESNKGQPAKVRGKLDRWHRFVASVVVVGEGLKLVEGTAESEVDSSGQFSLRPLGEVTPIQVQIFNETLLLFGCDTKIDDTDIIKPGVIVRVVGKEENGELNAVIVFLREIVGEVTYFDENSGDLTIQANSATYDIFVPVYTPLLLVGDGEVPPELLCVDRQVRVAVEDPYYNSYSYDFKAKEVQIQPDQFQGELTGFLPNRVLVVEREQDIGFQEVYVPPDATILDLTATEGLPTLFFSELIIGDNLNLIGLYSCDNEDFTGFVVLKIGPPSP